MLIKKIISIAIRGLWPLKLILIFHRTLSLHIRPICTTDIIDVNASSNRTRFLVLIDQLNFIII